MAGQRPLLERAAAGDREAFALLYDDQVEGVYRYLLAWTGNPTEAADRTTQVFHAAMGWAPVTTGTEGEAAAWLTAMSRDALAQHQGSGGAAGAAGAAGDVAGAVARLGEPERRSWCCGCSSATRSTTPRTSPAAAGGPCWSSNSPPASPSGS